MVDRRSEDRDVVRRDYGLIGARYLDWRRSDVATEIFLNHALEALRPGAWTLDLGGVESAVR
jgi:hypothetical protein